MRALKTKDLALFSKIVSKIEIKEELKGMFVSIDATGKTKEEVKEEKRIAEQELGFKVIMLLVENYWKAEKEFYTLLASLTGKTMKEIEELPLDEFIDLLKQLQEDESFKVFFNLVAA